MIHFLKVVVFARTGVDDEVNPDPFGDLNSANLVADHGTGRSSAAAIQCAALR